MRTHDVRQLEQIFEAQLTTAGVPESDREELWYLWRQTVLSPKLGSMPQSTEAAADLGESILQRFTQRHARRLAELRVEQETAAATMAIQEAVQGREQEAAKSAEEIHSLRTRYVEALRERDALRAEVEALKARGGGG